MEKKNIEVTVSTASDSPRSMSPNTSPNEEHFAPISTEPKPASASISAPKTDDGWEVDDEEQYKHLETEEIWSEVTTNKAIKLSTPEKEKTGLRGGATATAIEVGGRFSAFISPREGSSGSEKSEKKSGSQEPESMDEVKHNKSVGARARRRKSRVKAKAMKGGVEAQAVDRCVIFEKFVNLLKVFRLFRSV